MAEKLNHHFVPRHHLKSFSGHPRLINLCTRDGLIVEGAAIRGQCARHKYYQSKEIEDFLCALENRHARVLRALLEIAWREGPSLTTMQKYLLREALMLQHGRTPRRAGLSASSADQVALYAFRQHVAAQRSKEHAEVLEALDSGKVYLRSSETDFVLLGIESALEAVPLTMDLAVRVLRNRTSQPFVLGDSPCAFTNDYRRDVCGLGVTGAATRGLMVSMPLDPKTQVLMFDSAVYHAPTSYCLDLEEPDDIELLNAVQVYSSLDCVYFADPSHSAYVWDLVLQHPPPIGDGIGGFGVAKSMDSAHRGELLRIYEPPLPLTLSLSLIQTDERPLSEDLTAVRSPEIVARFSPPATREQRPLPMSEMVGWVRQGLVHQDEPPKSS